MVGLEAPNACNLLMCIIKKKLGLINNLEQVGKYKLSLHHHYLFAKTNTERAENLGLFKCYPKTQKET